MSTSSGPFDGTTDVLDQRMLLSVLLAVKGGDFGARMPIDQTGMAGKVCDSLNAIIEMNQLVRR